MPGGFPISNGSFRRLGITLSADDGSMYPWEGPEVWKREPLVRNPMKHSKWLNLLRISLRDTDFGQGDGNQGDLVPDEGGRESGALARACMSWSWLYTKGMLYNTHCYVILPPNELDAGKHAR